LYRKDLSSGPPPEFPLSETGDGRGRRPSPLSTVVGIPGKVGKIDSKNGKIAIERVPKTGNFQNYRDQKEFKFF